MDFKMHFDQQRAAEVWENGKIPVVLRRGRGMPIRLRIPFAPDNRKWLKDGDRKKMPFWDKEGRYWEMVPSRLDEICERLLDRYCNLYVIQPFQELEKCSPSCREATGFECQCACMGANHGLDHHGGWIDISEKFSFRQGRRFLACRLMSKKASGSAI